MTGFATNAFVSPAIFLAIEAAETKQANGSPRGSLKMNPPGASQDEIDPAVIRRVAEGTGTRKHVSERVARDLDF